MAMKTEHGLFEAFSIQQGGYITITDISSGGMIQIDPFVLRELLFAHTDQDYFDMADEYCPECGGEARWRVIAPDSETGEYRVFDQVCPDCDGTGRVNG